jgi:hypothetical protein
MQLQQVIATGRKHGTTLEVKLMMPLGQQMPGHQWVFQLKKLEWHGMQPKPVLSRLGMAVGLGVQLKAKW